MSPPVATLVLMLGAPALLAAALSEEPRSCWAEVTLEPARVVVGEQVLYRVRIYSREDVDSVEWSHPPAFASLRTETLPGDPQPSNADVEDEHRVRDERRALFPERAGALVLRAPELRCTSRGEQPRVVPVPDVMLEVADLPMAGRPAGFDRLVGPLSLHVNVTPQALRLGESLRVAVMARGGGNLWTLQEPFAAGAFGRAELFPVRPELVLERGRTLFLRRHFAYDVVPRETGVLEVPALALAYFDPETRSYRMARSEAVRIAVAPREAPSSQAAAPASRTSPLGGETASGRLRWWLALPLLLLLVPLARRFRRASDASGERVRTALEEAKTLEAAGDSDALAASLVRALRAALAAHCADAQSVAPEELMLRPGIASEVSAAAHLLASLERARFDPEAPRPDAGAVRRAIAEL